MHISCQFLQVQRDACSQKDDGAGMMAEARLILAFSGQHRFDHTRWTEHCLRSWVLDVIVQGRQLQRVGDLPAFERTGGVLALYAPQTAFFERQKAGRVLNEAYMVFECVGVIDAMLRSLIGPHGYCYLEDPFEQVIDPLKRMGRRFLVHDPSVDITIHSLMLACIGNLATSAPLSPDRRVLSGQAETEEGLLGRVSAFLEANLERPVRVSDMAAALGMSSSALAHVYPKEAGETPYRAILRSKINAAKRLLLSKGLNVQETADRLGFQSAFSFSRVFKRLEGCPPSEYLARYGRGRQA